MSKARNTWQRAESWKGQYVILLSSLYISLFIYFCMYLSFFVPYGPLQVLMSAVCYPAMSIITPVFLSFIGPAGALLCPPHFVSITAFSHAASLSF
jgi:hypothetical protein